MHNNEHKLPAFCSRNRFHSPEFAAAKQHATAKYQAIVHAECGTPDRDAKLGPSQLMVRLELTRTPTDIPISSSMQKPLNHANSNKSRRKRANSAAKSHSENLRIDRIRIGYLIAEKSVGSAKTDSTLVTILPPASEASRTLIQSGSLLNAVPTFLGGVAAVVGQDVDERVLGPRFVRRHPVADVRHAMFFEQLRGVVAEPLQEIGSLPGSVV